MCTELHTGRLGVQEMVDRLATIELVKERFVVFLPSPFPFIFSVFAARLSRCDRDSGSYGSMGVTPNMDVSRMGTKLMSWNVRAINKPAKLHKIFSHFREQRFYLQETHLFNRDHLKLCSGGIQSDLSFKSQL